MINLKNFQLIIDLSQISNYFNASSVINLFNIASLSFVLLTTHSRILVKESCPPTFLPTTKNVNFCFRLSLSSNIHVHETWRKN